MRCILVVLGTFLLTSIANPSIGAAQDGSFEGYAGLSFPMGDFADERLEGDGFAELGFTVGANYLGQFGETPGLHWLVGAAAIVNGTDIDPDDIDFVVGVDEVDSGFHLNIPIHIGLQYEIPLETVTFFGSGRVGPNISRGPSFEIGVGDAEFTGGPDFAMSFGFGLTGGVELSNGIRLRATYANLGEPEIEYTFRGEDFEEEDEMEFTPTMFMISIGFSP